MPKKAIKKEAKYVCCKCGYDNTPIFEILPIPITKEIIKGCGINMAIKATLKEVLNQYNKCCINVKRDWFRIWLEKKLKEVEVDGK